jgi:hypothetical protein
MREKAFTLPEKYGGPDKGFSVVYDFSGEGDFLSPEVVRSLPRSRPSQCT